MIRKIAKEGILVHSKNKRSMNLDILLDDSDEYGHWNSTQTSRHTGQR